MTRPRRQHFRPEVSHLSYICYVICQCAAAFPRRTNKEHHWLGDDYLWLSTVRIPLVLCLDWPHQSTHQPLASGSHCLLLPQCSSTASSSNTGARYLQMNHTSSCLHSLLLLLFYISFSIHYPVHPVQWCLVYPLFTTLPFLTLVLDYVVGTLAIFKLPPLKDGNSIQLLHINLVVFSLPFCMLSCLV